MCKKEIMGLTLEELQTELAGLGMKKVPGRTGLPLAV